MRTKTILLTTLALTLSVGAESSWITGAYASESQLAYAAMTTSELKQWLEDHNVPLPVHAKHDELRDLVAKNWFSASAWTYDQYHNAQRTLSDLRNTAFETWDESALREFLLRQGIVAPKGPREQLVLLAKSHHKGYESAAKSFTDRVGATANSASAEASKKAEGMASRASVAVAQAETEVARALDRSKDYVYSTWDDNMLRTYLESKGLIKTKSEQKRDEMLALMENHYNQVTTPIWEAWSDSYMHEWLVTHHIIKSDFEKNRDVLRNQLERFYSGPQERVWSTWNDSELRQWLVDHGVIKNDAEVAREKMLKMIEDNYLSSKDTFWNAWSDNQIRQWLIDHGYLRSDAQVKRDELIKLANEKYTDLMSRTGAYLTWPDARLRAFLREHGFDDSQMPATRPGLLQETRVRWVQAHTRAEAAFLKIREIVNEGVGKAEDALHRIMNVVTSGGGLYHGYESATRRAEHTAESAEHHAQATGESILESIKAKLKGEL